MRDLFYGLYLVSEEDIGQKPSLAADEGVDQERCYKAALDWLKNAAIDPDLAEDTRVAVPIFRDANRNITREWMTLGVRLVKLNAGYHSSAPPSMKPANGTGEWEVVKGHQLGTSSYLIAVDEFAEVELKGNRVLNREELRAICDRERTKENILAALQR